MPRPTPIERDYIHVVVRGTDDFQAMLKGEAATAKLTLMDYTRLLINLGRSVHSGEYKKFHANLKDADATKDGKAS